MMTSRLPELRRRLKLEMLERVSDGSGGYAESWTELGTLWADIKAGTGRERENDLLAVSQVPYRITVRSAPAGDTRRPRPDQRFREGSRVFRVLAVADADPHGRYLVCQTREEEVSG